jgi:hypothetical protein
MIKKGELAAIGVALLCAIGISRVQPFLAHAIHKLKQRDDVVLLPPPERLPALTLGYKSAAADLLWVKLVLESGLHWQERRAFPEMPRYIDSIIAVEPDHPVLYQFVDTFLLLTPVPATDKEARLARQYMERGTRERPYDPDVWLHYGQYIAFLAPSFLKDENEIEAWRRDGAFAILKAVELGADAGRSLGALTMLRNAGETQAAIAHLRKAYALANDEETRLSLMMKFKQLGASVMDNDVAKTTVDNEWRARYPFLSRGTTLLIGPYRSPTACAGPASWSLKTCPRDWSGAILAR